MYLSQRAANRIRRAPVRMPPPSGLGSVIAYLTQKTIPKIEAQKAIAQGLPPPPAPTPPPQGIVNYAIMLAQKAGTIPTPTTAPAPAPTPAPTTSYAPELNTPIVMPTVKTVAPVATATSVPAPSVSLSPTVGVTSTAPLTTGPLNSGISNSPDSFPLTVPAASVPAASVPAADTSSAPLALTASSGGTSIGPSAIPTIQPGGFDEAPAGGTFADETSSSESAPQAGGISPLLVLGGLALFMMGS